MMNLDVVTSVAGGVAGMFTGAAERGAGIIEKMLDQSHQRQLSMMKALNESFKETAIPAGDKTLVKRFMRTRKNLAYLVFFYVYAIPGIATFCNVATHVAYVQNNGWLKALFSGSSQILWHTVPAGYVLAPIQCLIATFVATQFFVGQNWRKL